MLQSYFIFYLFSVYFDLSNFFIFIYLYFFFINSSVQ